MRVRFLTRSAGPSGVIHPGEIVDVPDSEAALLIDRGFAEAVAAEKQPSKPKAGKEEPEANPNDKPKASP